MEELILLRVELVEIKKRLMKEVDETGEMTAAARYNQIETVINMIDDRIDILM